MRPDNALLAALIAGELGPDETQALLDRLESEPALARELAQDLELDSLLVGLQQDTTDATDFRQAVRDQVRAAHVGQSEFRAGTMARVKALPGRRRALAIAAGLIAVASIGIGWWLLRPSAEAPTSVPALAWKIDGPIDRLSPGRLRARESVTLSHSDGSTLRLSPGAIFDLPRSGNVILRAGRLLADISHRGSKPDQRGPLVIVTPAARIEVLGTRFILDVRPEGTDPMSPKSTTTAILVAGVILMSNPQGLLQLQQGDVAFAEEGAAPAKQVAGLTDRFGKLYKPTQVTVKPSIPSYTLPLAPEKIGNMQYVMSKLGRSDAFRKQLLKSGVAAGFWKGDDFAAAYKWLRKAELPVYVTTDSLLHLYHIQFDETLKQVEQTQFIRQLDQLSGALIRHLLAQRKGDDPAIDRALAFVALGKLALTDRSVELADLRAYRREVAQDESWQGWKLRRLWAKNANLLRSLTQSAAWKKDLLRGRNQKASMLRFLDRRIAGASKPQSLNLPPHVRDWVDRDRAAMAKHAGFSQSAIFHYDEDFSQYVPRGHYTRSYALQRYFNTMMWYGRMTFLIEGGSPHGPRAPFLVSAIEARSQTAAACHLTRALRSVTLDGQQAWQIWQRIYNVTAFFVGLSDDLTASEYHHAFSSALGKGYTPGQAFDADGWAKVKARLAQLRKPAIYSGTGDVIVPPSTDPKALDQSLARTQGFRLMGQRFVPDSYIMGQLIYPTVKQFSGKAGEVFSLDGKSRAFSRGLDVMALLGSKRAVANLKASQDSSYEGYQQTFDKLRKEFGGITEAGWNANLYWSWLYCLKGLLREYPAGYQPYMRTDAWKDKQLTAALGSWAQLRHDTILHTKQAYQIKGKLHRAPKDFPGYVEPAPQFYGRLRSLNQLTLDVLGKMQVLDDASKKRLRETDGLLASLIRISVKELSNQPLSADDASWIKRFDRKLMSAVAGYGQDAMATTLIADVMTSRGQVLEEATGKLGLIVVANRLPDGSIGLAAGPVFTYYEFKQPKSRRLTDEAWRAMLRKGNQADKMPEFSRSYFVRK